MPCHFSLKAPKKSPAERRVRQPGACFVRPFSPPTAPLKSSLPPRGVLRPRRGLENGFGRCWGLPTPGRAESPGQERRRAPARPGAAGQAAAAGTSCGRPGASAGRCVGHCDRSGAAVMFNARGKARRRLVEEATVKTLLLV